MIFRACRQCFLFIGVLALFASVSSVQASTVREMSFDEVVALAELVFEGQVLGTQSRQMDDGSIYTFVHFRVDDVIKGRYADAEIELRFLGGQVGARALRVSDMDMPETGESGIYFVESLSNAQIHPFVGWAQGHFLLAPQSGGVDIVTTQAHIPVVGLSIGATPTAMNLSKGVAKGVELQSGQGTLVPLSRPMTAEEFKQSVRDIATQAQ